MSVKQVLFSVGMVTVLGVAAYTKIGQTSWHKPPQESNKELWLKILSGSQQANTAPLRN